ncbi:hypothetical protein RJT34_32609 [Clitoria ternatea]|uniref:Uncharacterized protein n=1 Tax=Clitoria ternatea TaxID=43366 RepID=A0AAN9EXS5_CLITE
MYWGEVKTVFCFRTSIAEGDQPFPISIWSANYLLHLHLLRSCMGVKGKEKKKVHSGSVGVVGALKAKEVVVKTISMETCIR